MSAAGLQGSGSHERSFLYQTLEDSEKSMAPIVWR